MRTRSVEIDSCDKRDTGAILDASQTFGIDAAQPAVRRAMPAIRLAGARMPLAATGILFANR
jgi:hypothetical protein